jgi:predicted TPR repeat methyltransferase
MPNFIIAHIRRGQALRRMGLYDKAIKAFENVLELDPKDDFSKD